MIQGLYVRQYFQQGTTDEKALAARIDKLWKEVDFNWYRNGKMYCTGTGVLTMNGE